MDLHQLRNRKTFYLTKARNHRNVDKSHEYRRIYYGNEYPGHSEVFGELDYLIRRQYRKQINDIKHLKEGYYKINTGDYTYTIEID